LRRRARRVPERKFSRENRPCTSWTAPPATGTQRAAGVASASANTSRGALRELVRDHRGRLARGAALDLAEAFGYYGLFALLSVVVLERVHISQAQVPFCYPAGNLAGLVGGLAMSTAFDRVGHRGTVIGCYLGAAAAVGLLTSATATGSAAWVTAAFALANAFGTAAWTAAYPTFTELFPTHPRGAGVGTSVAGGRVGAVVGTLALPTLAAALTPTPAYLLVVGCWLLGAAAMAGYALDDGADATGRPLQALAEPSAAAPG
jgi:MFS family permease